MAHLLFLLTPPDCLLRCFPLFCQQNTVNRSDILSTPPQKQHYIRKQRSRGVYITSLLRPQTICPLRSQFEYDFFSPSKYLPVRTSAIFTHTSTISTRMSTILRSIDTRVVWVPIFNHYCSSDSIVKTLCTSTWTYTQCQNSCTISVIQCRIETQHRLQS